MPRTKCPKSGRGLHLVLRQLVTEIVLILICEIALRLNTWLVLAGSICDRNGVAERHTERRHTRAHQLAAWRESSQSRRRPQGPRGRAPGPLPTARAHQHRTSSTSPARGPSDIERQLYVSLNVAAIDAYMLPKPDGDTTTVAGRWFARIPMTSRTVEAQVVRRTNWGSGALKRAG